jgi:hypothetical protein
MFGLHRIRTDTLTEAPRPGVEGETCRSFCLKSVLDSALAFSSAFSALNRSNHALHVSAVTGVPSMRACRRHRRVVSAPGHRQGRCADAGGCSI